MQVRVLAGFAVQAGAQLEQLLRDRPTPRRVFAVLLFEGGGPLSLLALHLKLGPGPKTIGCEAARLRAVLGTSVLPRVVDAGHLELCVDREAVDLWRFRDHVERARHLRDDECRLAAAADAFEAAEAVWAESERQEAAHPSRLVLNGSWFREKRAVLAQERRQVRHEWAELMMASGQAERALAHLEGWVANDRHELVWRDYFVALGAAGAPEDKVLAAYEASPAAARPVDNPQDLADWCRAQRATHRVERNFAETNLLPIPTARGILVLTSPTDEAGVLNTNRRDALRSGVGALVVALTEPGLEVLAMASDSRTSMDPEALARALARSTVDAEILGWLETTAKDFEDAYGRAGPKKLLGPAQLQLETVIRLLGGPHSAADHRRLCAISGQLAVLVGALSFAERNQAAAHAWCEAAMQAAREIDDRALCGYILGNRSDDATYVDSPKEALDLALGAQEAAGSRASPWLGAGPLPSKPGRTLSWETPPPVELRWSEPTGPWNGRGLGLR